MSPVGLIINPKSRRNRDGSLVHQAASCDGLSWAAPHTLDDLTSTLGDFRQKGVRVLAVSGGDGTLRDVLSALPLTYGADFPDIALLPAGKTDLAARRIGSPGRGLAGLQRLLDPSCRSTLRRTEWPVLEVRWPDTPNHRVLGFLFGTAGFVTGTQIGCHKVHRSGIHDSTAVAFSIMATLVATLFGQRRQELLNGEPYALRADAAEIRTGRHFLTLATTLDQLVLGLTPFWDDDGSSAPLRWLDIPAPPKNLLSAVWPTVRGRPRRWMLDAGYASGRADSLHLDITSSFVIDGETFDAGPQGIDITATRRIRFVT